MNTVHGILIRADTHTVSDVRAAVWNGMEIRKKLLLHLDPIVYQDMRSDSIVIEAQPNVGNTEPRHRRFGFELFGKRYYGNALIVPEDGRDTPEIDPEEIAHRIQFFSAGTRSAAQPEMALRSTTKD